MAERQSNQSSDSDSWTIVDTEEVTLVDQQQTEKSEDVELRIASAMDDDRPEEHLSDTNEHSEDESSDEEDKHDE